MQLIANQESREFREPRLVSSPAFREPIGGRAFCEPWRVSRRVCFRAVTNVVGRGSERTGPMQTLNKLPSGEPKRVSPLKQASHRIGFTPNWWHAELVGCPRPFGRRLTCSSHQRPSSVERSVAAFTADMTASRNAFSSNAFKPSIVVPPGLVTRSRSTPGCSPVEFNISADPITV